MKKRILALTLVATMTMSALTGCGKNDKKSTTKNDIEIAYWNSGLGSEWLDKVIEAFETKYPEYHVTYTASASTNAVAAAYGNEDTDTVDLYMSQKSFDTKYMEKLNDVLEYTVDGESKKIGDKFDPAYLNMETDKEGNVYQLTYGGGSMSFVYNKTLFEKAGITTLPRTTDEFAKVCDTLFAEDITPLCHFNSVGYWDFINEVWFAQYEGMDYYQNSFYGCVDDKGNSPSKDVFTKKDGRYKVMQACEKIVTPDYVLQGSNSNDHITMQTEFLHGKAAIMINGAWLSNEMASIGGTEDFAIMKVPVISSITDKLTTVKKEMDLRKVIAAIDSVTDGEKKAEDYKKGDAYEVDGLKVSAADWEYIRLARNTVANNYSGESMYIPSYSNAKEAAKTFMKYLYSDEGYKVYADAVHLALPLTLDNGELDTSGWNSFEKGMFDLANRSEQVATAYNMKAHEIFSAGGASTFAGYSFVNKFCSKNAADRKDADSAWEEMLRTIDNKYENTWMANIKK